jgi:hypothetical protein
MTTGTFILTRLILLYDSIKILFKLSLYIGIGIPFPMVNFPNQEPIFLKLANFLSLILLPLSENHYCKIS